MAPTSNSTAMITELLAELVANANGTTESIVNRTAQVLCPPPHRHEHHVSRLHEFQIIKAVVLAVVTIFILASLCKMIFQLFVQYSGKHDDG